MIYTKFFFIFTGPWLDGNGNGNKDFFFFFFFFHAWVFEFLEISNPFYSSGKAAIEES